MCRRPAFSGTARHLERDFIPVHAISCSFMTPDGHVTDLGRKCRKHRNGNRAFTVYRS